MLVSYVLRLHTDRIGREEFAGEIEAVASGSKCGINSLHELMNFVQTTIETETSVIREARVACDEGYPP
jgi:hypothetical protein